ncbi:unnamed protein product [Acanthoscelides obtectus]|uniref:Uncharacterized protein n=1 Tax=Acanthoscelides obtectus TaxID=200917 RepID=A0A9P0KZ32_ACAOB|nr:unnamed protein product [Acanthoscelides obtectus]CAK1653130.1 hypothetical protein AOBTE_LOCUS18079 [Acanthoscelides obtectus]
MYPLHRRPVVVVSAEVHADADSEDAGENQPLSSKVAAANGLVPHHRRHRVVGENGDCRVSMLVHRHTL